MRRSFVHCESALAASVSGFQQVVGVVRVEREQDSRKYRRGQARVDCLSESVHVKQLIGSHLFYIIE